MPGVMGPEVRQSPSVGGHHRLAVLFDLDQTLIDSRAVEHLRDRRQWHAIYPQIPNLPPYPGIPELLSELATKGVPICVITSAPRPYCQRVLAHLKWIVA